MSCYESLPPWIDKKDIGDCKLEDTDKSTDDLLNAFSAALASFINCGLKEVTSETEHGSFTTVPIVDEGNW